MTSKLECFEKSTASTVASACRKAALTIFLSSLALPCFSQFGRIDKLFQVPGSPFPEVMMRWTSPGGCYYYMAASADFVQEAIENKMTFEWSGECVTGRPLNGSGELFGSSPNFRGEYTRSEVPYVGRMVEGRWEGIVRSGRNSYTFRNGCESEYLYLCRSLFNQLDAALGIRPASSSTVATPTPSSTVAPTSIPSTPAPSAGSKYGPKVRFGSDGRPTPGIKSF